jgi:hypothetical protein
MRNQRQTVPGRESEENTKDKACADARAKDGSNPIGSIFAGATGTGGESGIRTRVTVRVIDNPLISRAGMADRTSFALETTAPERNELNQSPTKIQQNQRSQPLSSRL